MTTFKDLGLAAPLLEAISAAGYTQPTPIQAKAIPAVLTGADLLGIAQTGTGKTAAFALPILQRLAADRQPAARRSCHVLVLSPTRELATQIAETFRAFGKPQGFTVAVVFGGVGHGPQIQQLARGVDILVATPGRLLDHLGERNISLQATRTLVLDEGDQMLDLGFLPAIRRVVAQLPKERQSLFFSATLAPEIEKLTRDVLKSPVKVAVAPAATTVELVDQRIIHIDAARKRALLVELLSDAGMSRTLIFTRTKRGADKVAKHLEGAGINAQAIHGNKSQRQREIALEAFKRGKVQALVATDIAARGIDIDQVTHVVNYELPEVPETYVHRIGRTARKGSSGIAISLCDSTERALLRDIERVIRQAIPSQDRRNDTKLEVAAVPASRQRQGDRRGPAAPRSGHGNGHGHSNGNGSRTVHAHARSREDGRDPGRAHSRGHDNTAAHAPGRGGHAAQHRGDGTSRRQGSPDQGDFRERSDRPAHNGHSRGDHGRPARHADEHGGSHRGPGPARPHGGERGRSNGSRADTHRGQGHGRPQSHGRPQAHGDRQGAQRGRS